jgi:hypothetical protein
MNATELLDDVRSQGVNLEANGERLLVDAPAGVECLPGIVETANRYREKGGAA